MQAMKRKVVIGGAGVAGLEAALALRALAGDRIEVEMVSPERDFVYRPLSVAEPFRVGEARRFPLERLVEAAGAKLAGATLLGVDPEQHEIATSAGSRSYDLLLLALGARAEEAIPGALTFTGPRDEALVARVLEEARDGRVERLVFALPIGAWWPLPLYELALLTAVHLADAGAGRVQLELVTPEIRPLQLFGDAASDAVSELLELQGVRVLTETPAVSFEDGALKLATGDRIEADRVIALPRLVGPRLPGVPHDANGFVPTDKHGAVLGCPDVFAAGDLTAFPVKQGGIAAQQADAAAESIAALAGASLEPQEFSPVLRGLLLTGLSPRYLRSEPGSVASHVDTEPLWWPPAKIVGRHLAPFLASHLGLANEPLRPGMPAVEVEVELDRDRAGGWARV
jgi:sulfide:quinone oxidoreductase